MNNTPNKLCLALAGLLGTTIAFADYDGTDNLLCSLSKIVECTAQECVTVAHADINAPDFIKLDFRKKEYSSLTAGVESEANKLELVQDLDDYLVVQAYQGGEDDDTLGWSMTIDHATGQFTAAAAGEGAAFVITGACTPL